MNKLKKRRKGFTLIEMVVVIAIVVIIAAIAIPQALKAINKSKASTDFANARTYAGQIMSQVANGDMVFVENENLPIIDTGKTTGNKTGITPSDTKLVKGGTYKYKFIKDATSKEESVSITINDKEVYPKATDVWEPYIK